MTFKQTVNRFSMYLENLKILYFNNVFCVALVAKDAITKPTHIKGMKWIISDKLISKKRAYQVQRGRREVKQTPQTQHIIIHHITFQTQTMWNSKMMDLA